MSRLLVCGLCPLPFENTLRSYGPGIRTWQFASSLARAGHEVHLLALRIPGTYESEPAREQEYEGVRIERLTNEDFFDSDAIADALDRLRPDAVVGATVYGSYVLARLHPKMPFWADQFGHFLAEAQAKAWLEGENWPIASFWRYLEPVLRTADKVSVVSRRQRFAAVGELGVAGRLTAETCGYEFTSVMPCPLMQPRPAKTRPILRPDPIPADAFVVLWSGGYNVWSDVATVFEGLSRAMDSHPRIHFVSTGGEIQGHNDRTYHDFLQRVERSEHVDRFHLLGWIEADQLPSVEAEADLGVLADVPMYEGRLGSKNRIVQWMGRRLPVVYNRIGDIGQLLADENLGLSFDVGDAEALAIQIQWAVDHPEELRDLAERAYRYSVRELSIDATTRELTEWAAEPRRAPDAAIRAKISSPADFEVGAEAAVPEQPGLWDQRPETATFERWRVRVDPLGQTRESNQDPLGSGRLDVSEEEICCFHPNWYLRAYPEIGIRSSPQPTRRQLKAAEKHYRKRGAKEGKNPNPYFCEAWYLAEYPAVAEAVRAREFTSGFDHYQNTGKSHGFLPTPMTVDAAWYFDSYPDALREVDSPDKNSALLHYLVAGARRGLSPHAAFDESWYLSRYGDVRQEVETGRFLSGYQHFLEFGYTELRQPHPLYGESYYRFLNPDVDAAVCTGAYRCGYFHLIRHGMAESRPWRMEKIDLQEAATRVHMCRLEEFLLAEGELDVSGSVGAEPEVSILLVLWNRAELTLSCLESIQRIRDVTFEVVIVDNLSTDRTRDLLERVRGATLVYNDENVGYTRAANQAAAAAKGRYLLNLNNDTELLPHSLRSAVDRLESTPEAGVVGGRIVTLDGNLQEAGSIVWSHGGTEGYGRGDDPLSGAYRFPREVDYCSGVFLLTPRVLFERFGGYDLLFTPAYYEESDYCFRLREQGFTTVYDPGCVVIHFETASLADTSSRTLLLQQNRKHFVERHRKQLENAFAPDVANFYPASQRHQVVRGRILMLDDYVPLERLGGGSPRAREILLALRDLDCFVTFFATNPLSLDRADVRREFPEDGIEFIDHLGRGAFMKFWQQRRSHYDALIVSRAHNFRELLAAGFDPQKEPVRVIYDAEAVVARRQELHRQVVGDDAVDLSYLTLAEEQALARSAHDIWAVNEDEGRLLAGPDREFHIVGLGAGAAAGERPFTERHGILFVGRLDEEWNPNVDSLRWYLDEVHSRVARLLAELGEPAPGLTVVGKRGDYDLPEAEGLEFLGRLDDLASVFDSHRIFVAPTRFAAGIPHKIVNAALRGLPVVATSLLAKQLGWRDGAELADGGSDDPERFAEQVARVYSDEGVWHTIRSAALGRARTDHGPDSLRIALSDALDPIFPTR